MGFAHPFQSVYIPKDGTSCGAIDARSTAYTGVIIPPVFDGQDLQFSVSHDGVTWVPLYSADAGGQVPVDMKISPGRAYPLPADVLAPWPYFRIVAMQQTASRQLVVCGWSS